MANKPLPANIHLLQNTHRKDRHGDPKKKPKLKNQLPTCPRWLPVDAKAEWKRICKVMNQSGVLTEADQTTLTQYCLMCSEMKEEKENFPAAKHTQLRLCCVELGLTPSARSRLTVDNDDDSAEF